MITILILPEGIWDGFDDKGLIEGSMEGKLDKGIAHKYYRWLPFVFSDLKNNLPQELYTEFFLSRIIKIIKNHESNIMVPPIIFGKNFK